MSRRSKVALVGVFLLVIVAVILYYHIFASPLSSKRIDIAMHDPATLQAGPTSETFFLECSIQLPKECARVDARGSCIVARSQAIDIDIDAQQERSDPDFKKYVAKERQRIVHWLKETAMLEEGRATIDGHNAYVMTYHLQAGRKDVPAIVRVVYLESPKSKFYKLRFACDETDWSAKVDMIDSSISTFHINSGN